MASCSFYGGKKHSELYGPWLEPTRVACFECWLPSCTQTKAHESPWENCNRTSLYHSSILVMLYVYEWRTSESTLTMVDQEKVCLIQNRGYTYRAYDLERRRLNPGCGLSLQAVLATWWTSRTGTSTISIFFVIAMYTHPPRCSTRVVYSCASRESRQSVEQAHGVR